MSSEQHRIPDSLLFELFDFAFGVGLQAEKHWKPAATPTAESVKAIEAALEIRLPSLLLEVASRSRYYSRYFAELGPDSSSNLHILPINQRLAGDGKPDDLVVLNQPYDGCCGGMFRSTTRDPDTTPIVLMSLDLRGDGGVLHEQVLAADFRTYLENLCLDQAPRSRTKSLRRKAKRLLSKWRGQ